MATAEMAMQEVARIGRRTNSGKRIRRIRTSLEVVVAAIVAVAAAVAVVVVVGNINIRARMQMGVGA